MEEKYGKSINFNVPSGEYWNKPIETMPRGEIRRLQWKRLQKQLRYVYSNSKLYKIKFSEANVTPEDIKSLDDVKRLPFTVKDELREHRDKTGDAYGGLLCVPQEEAIFSYGSSGTTGKPTIYAHTRNDHEVYTEYFARFFWAMGVRPKHKVLFPTARWAGSARPMDDAVLKIGGTLIPTWGVPLESEVNRMFNLATALKPDVIWLSPAAWAFLKPMIEKAGYSSPKEAIGGNVKIGITSGQAISDYTRGNYEKEWDLTILQLGGLQDVGGLGGECGEKNGLHYTEDFQLIELIDPDTGEAVSGEHGEPVFTNLLIEATPVVRWRSEDHTQSIFEPCNCGRTHVRIKTYGRSSDLVKVKGRGVLPIELEDELFKFPEIDYAAVNSMIVKTEPEGEEDILIARIAYIPERTKDPKELQERLKNHLEDRLGIPVKIELIPIEEAKQYVIHKMARVIKLYEEQ